MKIVSAILATFVLFLTMQPVLTNSSFIAKTKAQPTHNCCSNNHKTQLPKSNKQQENENNCCNNKHCDNPFLICANCYFVNSNKSTFSIAHFFIPFKRRTLTNDRILSMYIQDFWHPPETV